MDGILQLFSFRAKRIDETIANSTETFNNIFYDNMEFREPLEQFVKKLERVLEQNTNIQNYFSKLNKEADKIGEMEQFLSNMDEVDTIVG